MAKKLSKREEENQVFEYMGRILSEWRFLEDNLASVFDGLIDSHHDNLPSVIYYSINSFPVRLKMIDTMLKWRFGQYRQEGKLTKRLREWKNLRKRIKELETLRNVVAHTHVPSPPGFERVSRAYLEPSIFDGTLFVRYNPRIHPTLYLKDLKRIHKRITRTWESISRFFSHLPSHPKRSRRR